MADTLLRVGDKAPDFKVKGIPDGEYSLSQFLGQVVVLAFYPADNSPVCTTQMRAYSLDSGSFEGLNAVVLGISPQDVASHQGFASKHDISIPLLSDPDKTVAKAYGVLGPLGFYRRSIFVIDRQGIVTYLRRTKAGLTYSPTSVLIDAINQAEGK